MEIESRLLPCGLHVVGSPPSAAEAVATLVSIAEIDRPENEPPTRGMPGILAAAAGRRIEELYANSNKVWPLGSLALTPFRHIIWRGIAALRIETLPCHSWSNCMVRLKQRPC